MAGPTLDTVLARVLGHRLASTEVVQWRDVDGSEYAEFCIFTYV